MKIEGQNLKVVELFLVGEENFQISNTPKNVLHKVKAK